MTQPTPRLFVGSLPYKFTEGQLLSLFVPFGRVIAVQIVHNQWGKSRGLGFVEYDTLDSAISAKKQLHHYQLGDRTIIVDFASPNPVQTVKEASFPRSRNFEFSKKPKNQSPGFKSFNQPARRFGHQRQSVYDSRHHGAGIGRKFARKSKKKKHGYR
jgi:RNA recognition motif-containing protein